MEKIVIVSAKFTPGFLSHIEAYHDAFVELGYQVALNLDEGYRLFADELKKFDYRLGIDVDFITQSDAVWVTNASIHDHVLYREIKHRKPEIRIYTIFHEPFRGYWGEWKRCGEIGPYIRCVGRHVFARNVLKYSDMMVLPSKTAEDLYQIKDYRRNKHYCILPLLFSDHFSSFSHMDRQYLSFIGNASKSKGYPDFLKFIAEDARHNTHRKYQIASKYAIKEALPQECKDLMASGRLVVNDDHPLTNDEINEAYASSTCVWLCYRDNTQSGVICKAQMFGDPCIATKAGEFRTALDESTAVFVNDITDYAELNAALSKIEADLDAYSTKARQAYLEKYDYRNYLALVKEILDSVK